MSHGEGRREARHDDGRGDDEKSSCRGGLAQATQLPGLHRQIGEDRVRDAEAEVGRAPSPPVTRQAEASRSSTKRHEIRVTPMGVQSNHQGRERGEDRLAGPHPTPTGLK